MVEIFVGQSKVEMHMVDMETGLLVDWIAKKLCIGQKAMTHIQMMVAMAKTHAQQA